MAWGIVWRKEMKENLRDRRTLFSAFLFGPLSGPLLFTVLLSTVLGRAVEQTESTLRLMVVGAEQAPNLVRYLGAHGVEVVEGPSGLEAATELVRSQAEDLVLRVPPNFADRFIQGRTAMLQLVVDEGRQSAAASTHRVASVIHAYGQELGLRRLLVRGIHPEVVRPVALERIDISTPTARSVAILGVMTYLLLFVALMGGMHVTNDSTAGERERKSLEPLLTTPVSRAQIIFGKILAAVTFMAISLAIGLGAMSIGLRFIPLEELGMQTNFGMIEVVQIFFLMLPFVLFGAGMMAVVASFTRTYKEAQTYLAALLMVPTVPIIFASMADLKVRLWMMAVPSLSQHFLITSLMKGEALVPIHLVVSVVSTLAAAALFIGMAMRLYHREGILG